MAQTSIQASPDLGQAGALASTAGLSLDSRIAEAAVAVGIVVSQGTADNECDVTIAAGAIGISRLVPSRTTADYSATELVSIVVKGDIWVATAAAATAGLPVYVLDATGVINGNTATSSTLLPNAQFLTTTAGAGLVKVRLGANV